VGCFVSLMHSVDSKSAEGVEGGVTHIEKGDDAGRLDSNWESLSTKERRIRSKSITSQKGDRYTR